MPQDQLGSFSFVSPWCNSAGKRSCDFVAALVLLIFLLPWMVVLGLAVKLSSAGPILFRQRRPGKHGKEFNILKFRTMVAGTDQPGPVLTRAADPRITWLGRFMRKWKLDELPQLLNVLCGQMSFVGPRPQPTKLWNQPSIREEASIVLSVRPGITSRATLNFRNEEELLAPLSPEEVENVYMQHVMPLKLHMDIDYLRYASFIGDLRIIFRTAFRIFKRQEKSAESHVGLVKERLSAVMEARGRNSCSQVEDYETIAGEGD